MNFKPTLLKSTMSFFSSIVVNYLLAGTVKVQCMLDANNPSAVCPQPTWVEFAFNPVPVVISLLVLALVYSIWSFIQKK